MNIKLMAVGDISLEMITNKNPFHKVMYILNNKDILVGNLETVLSTEGNKVKKNILLTNPPEKVKYLKKAGFDIVNVANNHTLDRGPQGFQNTLSTLENAGIKYMGENKKVSGKEAELIEKKGLKFGFLGYTKGNVRCCDKRAYLNPIDEHKIISDIKKLKTNCDLIIVSLHWGIEDVFYPSLDQINLARKLIDTGASIILGHHPHFVQAVERYKHGLIAYSLANFQFNTNHVQSKRFNNKSDLTFILAVDLSRDEIKNHEIIPIKIKDNIPCILEGKEKKNQVEFIERISKPVENDLIFEKWWFEQIANNYLIGNMESWVIRIKKYGIKHFFQFVRWLVSPFNMKCYLALMRRRLRRI